VKDLEILARKVDIGVIATKAQEVRNLVVSMLDKDLKLQNCIVSSKGFSESGELLCDIVQEVVTDDVGIIAGPNFASEVLNEKLTFATIASSNPEKFKEIFHGEKFKIEICNDIVGVQVCSIMKNIYAIGGGIVSAAFESENTKAAFITVAFNELMQAIQMFGGEKETIYTSAGIGDFILTCYSENSRNHAFGKNFVHQASDSNPTTVEGYGSLLRMPTAFRERLPLCKGIYRLLNGEVSIEEFERILTT
jgi:glycerol-3-phosphate dehydrogenase (NAD(P)+)